VTVSSSPQTTPASSHQPPAKKKRGAKVDLVGVAQECLDEIRRGNDDRDRNERGGGANFRDEDDAYGHYIATEVRKFNDEIVKHAVKSEIQNVILKAHMGYFSSFGGIPATVQAPNTQWLAPQPGWFPGPNTNPVVPAPPEVAYGYGVGFRTQRDMASSSASQTTFTGLLTEGEDYSSTELQ